MGQVNYGWTWEDLVLPEEELERLRSISRGLQRSREGHVPGQRAPAQPVLFRGAAGTGKTMAAQIIASSVNVPVHTLDLAAALTRPEHEFEEIAARAFQSAARDSGILVIDGAETLLRRAATAGWRGVRSAPAGQSDDRRGPTGANGHDTAEKSLSGLLRRTEGSDVQVIFTSTVTHGIGPAVTGRFHVVTFPLPQTEARKEIWRRSLPADAQVTESNLDHLAGWLQWPGGRIHRCCLAAADKAAREGVPVQLRHVASALDQRYGGGRSAPTPPPAPIRSGPVRPPLGPRPSETAMAPAAAVGPGMTVAAPAAAVRPGTTIAAPAAAVRPGVTIAAPAAAVRPGMTLAAPAGSRSVAAPAPRSAARATFGRRWPLAAAGVLIAGAMVTSPRRRSRRRPRA